MNSKLRFSALFLFFVGPYTEVHGQEESIEFCEKSYPLNTVRLSCSSRSVTDLSPLANLTDLTELEISWTGLTDLSPLVGLTGLTAINLSDNSELTDLRPLAGLTGLTMLGLNSTGVTDLSPLSGLTELTSLFLRDTQASAAEVEKLTVALPNCDVETDDDFGKVEFCGKTYPPNTTEVSCSFPTPDTHFSRVTASRFHTCGHNNRTEIIECWGQGDEGSLSDLSPLAGMTSVLTELDLRTTQAADLGPLAGLTGLTNLYLDETSITDLGPLAAMSSLEVLHLSNTQVTDLSPLTANVNLVELNLSGATVTDLSPLVELKRLTKIDISETQVNWASFWKLDEVLKERHRNANRYEFKKDKDFFNIEFCGDTLWAHYEGSQAYGVVRCETSAQADLGLLLRMNGLFNILDLKDSDVTDLSPIEEMTGLTMLGLSGTAVSDLAPLEQMTELYDLNLNDTAVTDLIPIEGMTGLTVLGLHGTAVADLSPIEGMTGLTVLTLSGTAVSDLGPLKGMTGLTKLYLNRTAVSDLAPLEQMTELTVLALGNTAITDLEPLKGMTGLTELYLSETAVSVIDPLERMTELTKLDLSKSQVTNLAPLSGLTKLEFLFLIDTQVTDLSPLAGLTGLRVGDSIAKVETANGKPFIIYGFEIDGYIAGQVKSWEGGKLEGSGVQFKTTVDLAWEEYSQITGDRGIMSDEPLLTKAGLVVAKASDTVPAGLNHLMLGETNASWAQVEKLRKALPNCQIHIEEKQAPPVPEPAPAPEKPKSLNMVPIPAGTFIMGSPTDELGRKSSETQHTVTITRGFAMSSTEVPQGLYEEVMGTNSSFHNYGPEWPVEFVTWMDTVEFANAMSEREGLDKCYRVDSGKVSWPQGLDCTGYRLPTEAEWEYAARAGENQLYSGSDDLDSVGWYSENSGTDTRPVASKAPNAWGLYDMSGNVSEWVWDIPENYKSLPVDDPTGPRNGDYRVIRGGGVGLGADGATTARVANRTKHRFDHRNAVMGFRVVRSNP